MYDFTKHDFRNFEKLNISSGTFFYKVYCVVVIKSEFARFSCQTTCNTEPNIYKYLNTTPYKNVISLEIIGIVTVKRE